MIEIMYFRIKTTRSTLVVQLVHSYRDQDNRPRQKILLSLGSTDIPKKIWKEVAEEVENRLKGVLITTCRSGNMGRKNSKRPYKKRSVSLEKRGSRNLH